MSQKWNLQDIRPAGRQAQVTQKPPVRDYVERKVNQDIAPRQPKVQPQAVTDTFDDSDISTLDVIDGNSEKRKRIVITAIVSLIIIVCAIVVNVFLGGAVVTVHPKVRDVSVQSNFEIFTAPQADQLGYELLALEETGERQVKAKGTEKVSLSAEGKIFVYNTSESTQRLIKNTRFESPDNLIFRIKESIEVPPAKKDATGKTVPGSVVADVFADIPGDKYNIAPTKFTVPGLKGSDQFNNIYGESTVAFSKGFEGEKFILDDQELNTAQQALHVELRDKLLARLDAEKPAGFIAYKDSVTFVYESLPSTVYGDSLATIKEKVRLQIPIFKEPDLAKFIAKKSVPEYDNEDVTLSDPSTLVFTYTDPQSAQEDISELQKLDITLKGTTKIVWKFDEEKLKSDLVSKKKSETSSILAKYGASISKSNSEIRPFWANSFPSSPKGITIISVLEE